MTAGAFLAISKKRLAVLLFKINYFISIVDIEIVL